MSDPQQLAGKGIELRELYFILRRRRLLVLGTIIVGTALAVLVGKLQPERYTATTLVMVQPKANSVVDVKSVVVDAPVDAMMLETHVELLRSRDSALRVIENLGLINDAEFRPQPEDAANRWTPAKALQAVTDYLPSDLLFTIGMAEESLPSTAAEALSSPADPYAFALGVYDRRLSVTQSGNSYVLAISFSASDPLKAAKIANETAKLALQNQKQDKRVTTETANQWLANQLSGMRDTFLAAQAAAEGFRTQNGIVTVSGVEINDRQVADLSSQLVLVRGEKSEHLAKLQLIKDLRTRGLGLDTIADVVDSQLIINLRGEEIRLARAEAEARKSFGTRHPRMIDIEAQRDNLQARIQGEVDRIAANLQNEVSVSSARETNILMELELAKRSKASVGQSSIRLTQLEREAEAARRLYEAFQQRYEETKQQVDLVEPDGKVISRAAAPNGPDQVPLKFFAIAGFVASAVAGGFSAVFFDRLRATVRRGKDLETIAGIPCLGMIPKIPAKHLRGGPARYLLSRPNSVFAEAMRSVATDHRLTALDGSSTIVAVTSSIPGEGKSLFASSLAVTYARLGRRTLLIDLDLRRPSVAKQLKVVPIVGMAEAISDERLRDEAVIHDDWTGLDVVATTKPSRDPVALLSSRQLADYLSDLARGYERVVIDAPPLLGMSDARMIALLADSVVFVTKWDATSTHAITLAVKELDQCGASTRIAGGVVNGVQLRRHRAYGYGEADRAGYYREYRGYYDAG